MTTIQVNGCIPCIWFGLKIQPPAALIFGRLLLRVGGRLLLYVHHVLVGDRQWPHRGLEEINIVSSETGEKYKNHVLSVKRWDKCCWLVNWILTDMTVNSTMPWSNILYDLAGNWPILFTFHNSMFQIWCQLDYRRRSITQYTIPLMNNTRCQRLCAIL